MFFSPKDDGIIAKPKAIVFCPVIFYQIVQCLCIRNFRFYRNRSIIRLFFAIRIISTVFLKPDKFRIALRTDNWGCRVEPRHNSIFSGNKTNAFYNFVFFSRFIARTFLHSNFSLILTNRLYLRNNFIFTHKNKRKISCRLLTFFPQLRRSNLVKSVCFILPIKRNNGFNFLC